MNHPFDALEADVLARIAAHRLAQRSIGSLAVPLLVAFAALAGGLVTGISEPHPKALRLVSEAALLDDDVGLAPSSRLASTR